jgi:hypothetical protein
MIVLSRRSRCEYAQTIPTHFGNPHLVVPHRDEVRV